MSPNDINYELLQKVVTGKLINNVNSIVCPIKRFVLIGEVNESELIEEDAYVVEESEVILGSDLIKTVQLEDGKKIMFNMEVRAGSHTNNNS